MKKKYHLKRSSIRRIIVLAMLGMLCSQLLPAQDSIYYRAGEWKDQLDAYYKKDARQFPEKGQILFVGSSSILMWKALPAYFPDHQILARGFGGAWMSDLLYHMQRLVLDYKPGQIVLYCGENDISNGRSPQDVADDIKAFVRIVELQLPGVPVLILSIKPSPLLIKLIEKQRETNQLIYTYCQTKAHVKFIDISLLMTDAKGNPREDLYLGDRLHVNETAYHLWAQAIMPHLITPQYLCTLFIKAKDCRSF